MREDIHTNSITHRELPQFVRTISHVLLGLILSAFVIYFGSLLFEAIGKEVAKSVAVFEVITSIPLVLVLGLSVWILVRRRRLRALASGMLVGVVAVGVLIGLVIAFEW